MADFVLDVPLDASRIEGAGDQPLKVVGRAKDGSVVSTLVVLGADGRGSATLRFDTAPGAVQVAVGPQDATDEELLAAETIGARIPTVAWGKQKRLKIAPLDISSWHWGRWLRWCRTVTVRGRLVCPDGRPVPGATVCAYDVDWWFIWSSTQQVGCATTALDGTFEIKFRWCCGVYPWWWWFQQRGWQFNSVLSDQVAAALAQVPDLPIGSADRAAQPGPVRAAARPGCRAAAEARTQGPRRGPRIAAPPAAGCSRTGAAAGLAVGALDPVAGLQPRPDLPSDPELPRRHRSRSRRDRQGYPLEHTGCR